MGLMLVWATLRIIGHPPWDYHASGRRQEMSNLTCHGLVCECHMGNFHELPE